MVRAKSKTGHTSTMQQRINNLSAYFIAALPVKYADANVFQIRDAIVQTVTAYCEDYTAPATYETLRKFVIKELYPSKYKEIIKSKPYVHYVAGLRVITSGEPHKDAPGMRTHVQMTEANRSLYSKPGEAILATSVGKNEAGFIIDPKDVEIETLKRHVDILEGRLQKYTGGSK